MASAPDFGPLERYRADGRAGSFTPVRTATAYVAGQLGRQAAAALALVRSSRPAPGGTGARSASTGGLEGSGVFSAATLTRLRGCVARVAGGQSVLLVDQASFAGRAATIIVTAPPGSAVATQAWAVGPGCSGSAADVLAHQRLP